MIKDRKKIEEVLTRGVEQILPSKEGLLELMKKRKIRLYWGVDPTSPFLHLGHYSILRKLKEFQDLGHEVIFLIGDFTAKIGDPSGREEARKPLSEREIRENLKTYRKQIGKVLDLKKTKILRNSKWLSKMKLDEFLKIASFLQFSKTFKEKCSKKGLKKEAQFGFMNFCIHFCKPSILSQWMSI
jgi:tyrosyl-tRNA synthetase